MARSTRHGAVPGQVHQLSFADDGGPSPDVEGFMDAQRGYEPAALGQNLATMARVARDRQHRTALDSLYGSPETAHQTMLEGAQSTFSNNTGGWDAFFGALQNKQQEAAAHGLKFRARLGSLDLPDSPTSPSVDGLYSAFRAR